MGYYTTIRRRLGIWLAHSSAEPDVADAQKRLAESPEQASGRLRSLRIVDDLIRKPQRPQ